MSWVYYKNINWDFLHLPCFMWRFPCKHGKWEKWLLRFCLMSYLVLRYFIALPSISSGLYIIYLTFNSMPKSVTTAQPEKIQATGHFISHDSNLLKILYQVMFLCQHRIKRVSTLKSGQVIGVNGLHGKWQKMTLNGILSARFCCGMVQPPRETRSWNNQIPKSRISFNEELHIPFLTVASQMVMKLVLDNVLDVEVTHKHI